MNLILKMNGDCCLRLTFTLLHFLWQGAAIALLALAAGGLLRRSAATARYWVFVAALAAMAFCPPATFLALSRSGGASSSIQAPAPVTNPNLGSRVDNMEPLPPDPASPSRTAQPAAVAPAAPQPARFGLTPVRPSEPSLAGRLLSAFSTEAFRRAAPWVAACYFAGVLLMTARLLLSLSSGRSLRGQSRPVEDPALLALLQRAARAMRLRAAPAAAWCRQVAVPTLVGVLKPAILLPLSLASGLSSEQIEMLLLHELAHLRRCDLWVNLAQRLIETALFFHPAVWWLSSRVRSERETACDDVVLAAGIEKTHYAESLLRMAEISRRAVAPERVSALSMGSQGLRPSGFMRRVLRLMEDPGQFESIRLRRVWPLGVVLLAGTAVAAFLSILIVMVPPLGERNRYPTLETAGAQGAESEMVINLFGLDAVLELNKSTYDIGEPIIASLTIKNITGRTIRLDTGGDYRSGRAERFRFRVSDDKGKAVPDPLKILVSQNMAGGLGGGVDLAPGETHTVSALLNLYASPRAPSLYTVSGDYQLIQNMDDATSGRLTLPPVTFRVGNGSSGMSQEQGRALFGKYKLDGIHPCILYGLQNDTSRIPQLIAMIEPKTPTSPEGPLASPAERNAPIVAMESLVLMPDKAAVYRALEKEIAARRPNSSPKEDYLIHSLGHVYRAAITPESLPIIEPSLDHANAAVADLAFLTALSMGSAKALDRLPAALRSSDSSKRQFARENAFQYLNRGLGSPGYAIEGVPTQFVAKYGDALMEGFRQEEGDPARLDAKDFPDLLLWGYLLEFHFAHYRLWEAIGIAVESNSPLKHTAALRYLAKCGENAAFPPLEKDKIARLIPFVRRQMQTHPDARARALAMRCLGIWGDAESIPALAQALDAAEQPLPLGAALKTLGAVTVAMEGHKIDNNAYPNTLYQLTTPIAYLSALPEDPFATSDTQKLIRWKPDAKPAPLLYSIGPDRMDQGGDIVYDPTNGATSAGDIVRTLKPGPAKSYKEIFGADLGKQIQQDAPIEDLIKALENDNINQWSRATTFLAMRKAESKPAVPALVRALGDPQKRESALYPLQEMGPAAAEAAPALIRGLGEWKDHHAARWGAAVALANIGEAAAPALAEAAKNPDPIVSVWAHAALARNEIPPPYDPAKGTRSHSLLSPYDYYELVNPEYLPHLRAVGKHMASQDKRIASEALSAVQMIGPKAAPLMPMLCGILKLDNPRLPKNELVRALAIIGPGARDTLSQIIPFLTSPHTDTRRQAIFAVRMIGGPEAKAAVPGLVESLQMRTSPDAMTASLLPVIREEAADALEMIGPAAKDAMPALIEAMSDPVDKVRAGVVRAIGAIDPASPEALPKLIQAMEDPDSGVQYAANEALVAVGPVNTEVIRAFIRAVRRNAQSFLPTYSHTGPSGDIVSTSAAFFNLLGPEHRYAVPDLADLARDPHPGVQRLAFQALINIGEVPEDLVLTLIERVQQDKTGWAAYLLPKMGPKAAPAAPAMLKILQTENDPRRTTALDVLVAIGRPTADPAIPIIERALKKYPIPPVYLCEALLSLDPGSQAALDGLEKHLANPPKGDIYNIPQAHALLLKHGRNAPEHLEALLRTMNGGDSRLSPLAAKWIMESGQDARTRKQALDRIFAIQDDPAADDWAKAVASEGLRQIDPGEKDALPRLIGLIRGIKDQATQWQRLSAAVAGLGRFGPAAREALPDLNRLIQSRNRRVRDAAREAIKSIGSASLTPSGNPQ